jgi:hypothetical protein
MTVLTVNNLPAATHGETVRCLFAIEMSGLNWVIAFNTPLSEKISLVPTATIRLRTKLQHGENARSRGQLVGRLSTRSPRRRAPAAQLET